MSTREHWRNYEKRKICQLNDYASALERREKALLKALAELSRGLGIDTGGSWDNAMRRLAADRLEAVASMRVPERPIL